MSRQYAASTARHPRETRTPPTLDPMTAGALDRLSRTVQRALERVERQGIIGPG